MHQLIEAARSDLQSGSTNTTSAPRLRIRHFVKLLSFASKYSPWFGEVADIHVYSSHYNTAHFNNPDFEPEQWQPDAEYSQNDRPRKRSSLSQ